MFPSIDPGDPIESGDPRAPVAGLPCSSRLARFGLLVGLAALACACETTAVQRSGMRSAGPYLKSGVGPAVFDSSTGDDPTFSGDVDESDTAILFGGGYRFDENVAVEFAWVDLGEVVYDGTYSGTPARGTVKATGIELTAMGSYPVHDLIDLTGRAGVFVWDAEDSGTFGGGPFSEDNDGVDPVLAIGAQASLSDQLALRLEWTHFFDVWETDPSALLLELVVRI